MKHFLADLAERAIWTFVQAYAGYWLVTGAGFDTLFTLEGLKVAVAAAGLVVATAVVRRPIGSHDTASVLPTPAPPTPPPPPEPAPLPEPVPVATSAAPIDLRDVAAQVRLQVIDEVIAVGEVANVKVIPATVWTHRTQRWETVHLRPEASLDEGTFRLVDQFHEGLQVAEYHPERSATHTPIGPDEMSHMGLRLLVPHPDEDGN